MKEYIISRKLTGQYSPGKSIAKWKQKNIWAEGISALFVLLFSYAAVSKLTAYSTFAGQLVKSPYLERYAPVIAWLVPATECIIALLLLYKKTRLTGLFASFALMLLFTCYVYLMLHYSYYIPCSCGGVLAMMSWTQHFWFNVLFTILALTGIWLKISQPEHPR